MKSEKILLLDVHVEGMEERLKELEWNAITVTKLFGSTEQDRQDEKIFDYAKKRKNTVVVITQDQGLMERCLDEGIDVAFLDMEDLAEKIDEDLSKRFVND